MEATLQTERRARRQCLLDALAARGVPRLVNQLCDFSMIYAWSDERHSVTPKEVMAVLNDGVFFGDISIGTGT